MQPLEQVLAAVAAGQRQGQGQGDQGGAGQRSQDARRQIEALLETKVYLELWVKVRPKWRRSESELRRLGYR